MITPFTLFLYCVAAAAGLFLIGLVVVAVACLYFFLVGASHIKRPDQTPKT